jgi:hypothetical protein
MQYSVMAMAYGSLISGVCSQIVNAWPNKMLLHYSYWQQVRDFIPSIIVAIVAGGVSYGVGLLSLPFSLWIILLLQGFSGLVFYFFLAYLFRLEACTYLVNKGKKFLI